MASMVLKTTAQIIIILRVFKVFRNNNFLVGCEQIYKFIPKTASIKISVIPYYDT